MSKFLPFLLLLSVMLPCSFRASAQESEVAGTIDTLTINQRREMRGLSSRKNDFVPKGQWIFGGTASYSTHANDSYNFLIVEDINSDGYTVKASPFVAYAIKKNMAIGARFIYSRSLLNMDTMGISMGDEETGVNITIDGYYVLRHSYEGAVVWRNYIPLGQSKRFALFTDVQFAAGGIQGKYAEGQPVRGTYEKGYSLGLGVTPGIVAFATNNMAIEVTVGVMGVSYSHLDQVHNQVTFGERSSSDMSFKINILSVGLGFAFYL